MRKRFSSLAMWYPQKASAWRRKELRQSSSSLKPQRIRDIQVFLGFANFYCRFIQRFSQIATPLSLILKISSSTEFVTQLSKGVVEASGENRVKRDRNKYDRSEIDNGQVGDGKVNDKIRIKGQKMSKSKKLSKSKKMIGSLDFLTPRAKLAFIQLG